MGQRMRLRCYLREIREDSKRSLADLERATGISGGTLSQIERGLLVPIPKHLEAIERGYGVPPSKWYSSWAWAALAEGDEEAA